MQVPTVQPEDSNRATTWQRWLPALAGIAVAVVFASGYFVGREVGAHDSLEEPVSDARGVAQTPLADGAAPAPDQQQAAPPPAAVSDAQGTGQQEMLQRLVGQLENDRLLLAELRNQAQHENRQEAAQYWQTLKPQAVESDLSLGPMVDRVVRLIPTYYDWAESEPRSVEEAQRTYVQSGANTYRSAIDDFWASVLLVVIDHIDFLGQISNQG